jgi:glycosyltransferase involved in cell wall biosynthesis
MYAERPRLYGTSQPSDPRKAARLGRRERLVWMRADAVVTTTAGIRDFFTASYGERDRVRVISNGCDVASGRRFRGLASERPPRVVYAGQLYPWKGVDVLVEAMAQVPAAELVILGGFETEPDLERVRQLVVSKQLSGRTQMPGTVPQTRVAAELERATVVVVPFLRSQMSERHTSPIKAFEAMAAGRPIVASDLPSTREVLGDGHNALLVPPGDAGALAAAIRRLLEDRELAARLARTAFEDAPRYSWDERARRLVALFEEVA